jgi:GNAT superfamily N-acetyltransferase
MVYRIREVDGSDDDVADELRLLHELTFFGDAPAPDTDTGHWWLVYCGDDPVAFAGLTPSTYGPCVGYLKRVGVLPGHRGHGLHRRLTRVREARARRNGWRLLVTDTTNNPHSANNLIACGYRIFAPVVPWAFPQTIYWRKDLTCRK